VLIKILRYLNGPLIADGKIELILIMTGMGIWRGKRLAVVSIAFISWCTDE